jgi:hypothetical protein
LSRSLLNCHRNDARTVENGLVSRSGVSKSAKVVLGREPINLQGVRLARVPYAPIGTKFRSVGKCRDVPTPEVRLRSVRGSSAGPWVPRWAHSPALAAAILDNTEGEVENLKVQIGFLPRRPETEAPFCLEDYNNRIAPAQATSRQLAAPHVGRTNDDFIARGDYH